MVLGGVVLGDVGEMRQVIGVLAGAVDVPDLVLANQFLSGTRIRERGISTAHRLIDCLGVICIQAVGCGGRRAENIAALMYILDIKVRALTLVSASRNWTPR